MTTTKAYEKKEKYLVMEKSELQVEILAKGSQKCEFLKFFLETIEISKSTEK